MSTITLSVPQSACRLRSSSAGDEQAERGLHGEEAADEDADRRAATRLTLQRWSEIGRRGGASARNWATRSRPSCFITVRSWVGLATPRVAANASAISSGVK